LTIVSSVHWHKTHWNLKRKFVPCFLCSKIYYIALAKTGIFRQSDKGDRIWKVVYLWEFCESRGFCDKLNENFPKKSITSWSWSLSYLIISPVFHIATMSIKGQIIAWRYWGRISHATVLEPVIWFRCLELVSPGNEIARLFLSLHRAFRRFI
jgi:hypothetical protein